MRFSHRHTYGHCKSLTERACCRFHANGVAVFGMAGSKASVLAELLHVLHGQTIAVKMKQGIKQAGRMAGRKDESVPAGPVGVLRVMAHVAPYGIRGGRCTYGHAWVAAVGLLNGVCRKHADSADSLGFDGSHKLPPRLHFLFAGCIIPSVDKSTQALKVCFGTLLRSRRLNYLQ